jgi:hypothetical protein
MDNLEENSTTSSNGQTSHSAVTLESVSFNQVEQKRQTRSYKTELGKMTESRNRWQAIAISSFISIAILITALAYKIFQS